MIKRSDKSSQIPFFPHLHGILMKYSKKIPSSTPFSIHVISPLSYPHRKSLPQLHFNNSHLLFMGRKSSLQDFMYTRMYYSCYS